MFHQVGIKPAISDHEYREKMRKCMPANDQSPKAIHLQHKYDLLKAEKSFLKDQLGFVKKYLQNVSAELKKIKKAWAEADSSCWQMSARALDEIMRQSAA